MRASCVILFALTSRALGDVITTDAAKTDFVDILKRNLRRNNDDYVESTTVSVKVPNPYLLDTTTLSPKNVTASNQPLAKQDSFSYRRGPFNANKLFIETKNNTAPQRRLFDPIVIHSADVNVLTTNMTKPHRLHIVTRKFMTKTTRTVPKLTATTSDHPLNLSALNSVAYFRSSGKGADKGSKKINNIKKFIERNKQLFDEFMHKKRKETEKDLTPPPKDLRVAGKKSDSDSDLSDEKPGLRLRAHSYERTSLSPDQLDMAPAKGGQIHGYRAKGRLCQRNVLIPEGPKYNSRGEMYLAPYGHARGIDYARTRHPKYLLPRCCNCCKKSALGCE